MRSKHHFNKTKDQDQNDKVKIVKQNQVTMKMQVTVLNKIKNLYQSSYPAQDNYILR